MAKKRKSKSKKKDDLLDAAHTAVKASVVLGVANTVLLGAKQL